MSITYLEQKVKSRQARIAVIGLGYVGLPLAVNFAKAGFRVAGIDNDRDRIAKINSRQNYILDVPLRDITGSLDSGRLVATGDFATLKNCDVIIICVPTPIKRKYTPDISYIRGALKNVIHYLKRNTLIVLESTTYPGTTQELIAPPIEKKGFKIGRDVFLAFSPERIDPGNKKYNVTNITKVVGGVTPNCGALTRTLYRKIIKNVHMVSSARAAEMTKLIENTFRIINIGWINEATMMCHKMGIDVWEVIEAAATKPFGYMPFTPGLGVGGHCIPEDPLYLYWKAKHHGFNSKFIRIAAEINSHMPAFAIERIKTILNERNKTLTKARILIIGVTYKKDVKDLRKSPPLRLIELLQDQKASVEFFDPVIPYLSIGHINMDSIKLNKANIARYDLVVIATDHSKVNYAMIRQHAKRIFDVRNVYGKLRENKIVRF